MCLSEVKRKKEKGEDQVSLATGLRACDRWRDEVNNSDLEDLNQGPGFLNVHRLPWHKHSFTLGEP